MGERKHIDIGGMSFDVEGMAAIDKKDAPMLAAQTTRIDDDFCGWLVDQASALRERRTLALDWDNLAEELEAMAGQDRRTLRKQLQRLLAHLLKYRVQPEAVIHHKSWRLTIRNARLEIEDLIMESPGIWGGKEKETLAEMYQRAREDASDETGIPLNQILKERPWTLDQALHDENIVPPHQAIPIL